MIIIAGAGVRVVIGDHLGDILSLLLTGTTPSNPTTFTHGQIAEETGHAATQPDARARLAPPQRPRRRVLLVQQDRGRATHHQKGRAPSFFFSLIHVCLR